MRGSLTRRLGRLTVPIGAGLLVAALAASVWALTLRERANKRLYLEYEVYKAVTALTDIVRLQGLGDDDVKNILAFGLYASDGAAIATYGNAPPSMAPLGQEAPKSQFTVGESSVILRRSYGGDLPGRRMIMMGAERQGMGRMRGAPPQSPQGPEPYPDRVPALSYIEISTQGLKAEEAALLGVAIAASLALAGLYAVIVVMSRRYAALEDREARDRELVELGEAARTIAHEIKNPLGVIRIQCGILRRDADAATVSGLAIIDEEATRLADLTDRIRRFLKAGAGRAEPVPARRLLEEFAQRYRDSIDAWIDLPEGAVVELDRSRVIEALDNLVSNALDASAGAAEKPRLEAGLKQRRLSIRVLDRGAGIPAEGVGRLFEPFYTTKERGSGLGLALARKNVEASGGTVAYADRQGGGAAFIVSFPLRRGAEGGSEG